jgi:pleckstrin homology domain-containing family G member 4
MISENFRWDQSSVTACHPFSSNDSFQPRFDSDLKILSEMTEIGDSVTRMDQLVDEINQFEQSCQPDIERAQEVIVKGQTIIQRSERSASKDMVEPKCNELRRIVNLFEEKAGKRKETLFKARDLMERVENANEWCAKGIELLASQRIENVSVPPETAEIKLQEIIQFVESSEDFQLSSLRDFEESTTLLNLESLIVSQVRTIARNCS